MSLETQKQDILDMFKSYGAAPDIYVHQIDYDNKLYPDIEFVVVISNTSITDDLLRGISSFIAGGRLVRAVTGRIAYQDSNSPLDNFHILLRAANECGV